MDRSESVPQVIAAVDETFGNSSAETQPRKRYHFWAISYGELCNLSTSRERSAPLR